MGDEGAMHLSKSLSLNLELEEIYLSENNITKVGALKLSTGLNSLRKLRLLNLCIY